MRKYGSLNVDVCRLNVHLEDWIGLRGRGMFFCGQKGMFRPRDRMGAEGAVDTSAANVRGVALCVP